MLSFTLFSIFILIFDHIFSLLQAYNGTVAFVNYKDIPGENSFTASSFTPSKEEIFCSKKISFNGQAIGVILAETHEAAVEAADLVKVKYKQGSQKPLFSIKDVMQSNEKSTRIKQSIEKKAKTKGK